MGGWSDSLRKGVDAWLRAEWDSYNGHEDLREIDAEYLLDTCIIDGVCQISRAGMLDFRLRYTQLLSWVQNHGGAVEMSMQLRWERNSRMTGAMDAIIRCKNNVTRSVESCRRDLDEAMAGMERCIGFDNAATESMLEIRNLISGGGGEAREWHDVDIWGKGLDCVAHMSNEDVLNLIDWAYDAWPDGMLYTKLFARSSLRHNPYHDVLDTILGLIPDAEGAPRGGDALRALACSRSVVLIS